MTKASKLNQLQAEEQLMQQEMDLDRPEYDPKKFHFEPLIMLYHDQPWIHPMLVRYHKEEFAPFHRMWITFADNTRCMLVARSAVIDDYWNKPSKRKLANLKELVWICLIEDTWSPAREYYFAAGEHHPDHTEQFCFTEFGKAISQAFSKGKWSLELHPDEIGKITLEDDGWSFEPNKLTAEQEYTELLDRPEMQQVAPDDATHTVMDDFCDWFACQLLEKYPPETVYSIMGPPIDDPDGSFAYEITREAVEEYVEEAWREGITYRDWAEAASAELMEVEEELGAIHATRD